MRNEHDVNLEWRQIVNNGNLSEELFDRARQLLNDLSVESPLRFRLENELNELRIIASRRKR